MAPVVDHTIDGQFNGTIGSLDSYLEGSRLFHASESTDATRKGVFLDQFEQLILLFRSNFSLVADVQLHDDNIEYIGFSFS